MGRPHSALSDKEIISLTREALFDVERLRVRSLEVLAESERLLDLIDKINSPCIPVANK
jgi:hypothetical protein